MGRLKISLYTFRSFGFVQRSISGTMQNQGQGVEQLARATSASAIFARLSARSKGTPIPFAPAGLVQNEADASTPYWERPTAAYDRVFLGIPFVIAFGFLSFMNKVR